MRSNKGFTLLELIVVIAILAIFGAIVTPTVTSNLKNAEISVAKKSADSYRTAIWEMLIHLRDRFGPGIWPPEPVIPELQLMYSEGKVPVHDTNIVNSEFFLSDQNGWGDPYIDTFHNQLIANTPGGTINNAYPTLETAAGSDYYWRGPYLLEAKADPWGNQYSCNLLMDGDNFMGVISAGPDGIISTSAIQSPQNVVVGGDDILVRLE